ncbi:MAG: hypothetical protein JNL90_11420 [Planctomycetes bacterium]|nr:hypothetical protein [Planctomycetota bacterium]
MSGSSHLWGAMIAADAADDLYVVGSYPFAFVELAKLDRAGNVLWQVEFDNPGTREQGSWLALDPSGNPLVSGYLVAGSSQTPSGFVTLKYDPAGNLQWSDVISYTFGRTARIASDAAGNAIVLGSAFLADSSGFFSEDLVTIKYAPDGTKLWTRTAGYAAGTKDSAGGLVVDAAGNSYVTGGTLGGMVTEAYDPNGGLLWRYTTSSSSSGWDLALSPTNELAICASNGSQMVVHQLDAAGNLLWSNGYGGILGTRLAFDSASNLVVTGYQGTGGYLDWLTHKIAPDGSLLWSATYDRHQYNDEVPYGLTIGPDDEIYVTGQGGPGPTSGNLSYLKTVTVRYAPDGTEEWYSANDKSVRGRGVVRLSDNSVATVGESTFTVFHYAQTGVWNSLGGALAGSNGLPKLRGTGHPAGSNTVGLELTGAKPLASTWLIVGASRIDLPFMSGTLLPAPDVVLPLALTDANGALSLSDTWPDGLPSGEEWWFQCWISDPAAPRGLAASNGVRAVSQ